MPRFSANLSTLFLEHPPLARPLAARDAGFDAVEIQFPYEHSAHDWRQVLDGAGVSLALFNLPVADMMSGGAGLAAVPGREMEFRKGLDSALEYAKVLSPGKVNVLAGWPGLRYDRDACLDVLASNLSLAAEAFAPLGIGVVIEAINTVDRPHSLISTTSQALEIIDRAGHANLAIQYDIYHMQIMEGDLIRSLRTHHERIGHIQFADNPGRGEPGTGEINFTNVFAAIDELPYSGFIGAEYNPTRTTEDTLAWMR